MLELPPFTPPPRLLAFGAALIDELAEIPEEFLSCRPGRKGGSHPISAVEREALRQALSGKIRVAPGGAAGNTARAFAALGGTAGMLSLIGDDHRGDFFRQALQSAGVTTAGLKLIPGAETGSCLSLVTPDGERSMRPCLGIAEQLHHKYFSAADFRAYSHFYVEGYILYTPDIAAEIFSLAQSAGLIICYDAGSPELVSRHRQHLQELLKKYVSVALFNEQEAAAFYGDGDLVSAARRLSQLCQLAVVKGGEQGAWVACAEEVIHIPAQPAEVCDTTGAGDFWAAGFLYAWLNGCTLAAAGQLAAAVSAAVVAQPGANLPAKIWRQLRQLFVGL